MADYNDYSDADPFMAAIHTAILNDDPNELARACQEDVDLDERFSNSINEMHYGMTPLALACALNKPVLAEVLINNGADVNATFATLNTTALMTSAFHGHVEIVRLLLRRGADVRILDLQQSTALGYAFGGTRHVEVINMLLQSGVDVNQKNMLGMNALLLVAGYGNDSLVQMVLQSGADPNATNDFGHTALHLAVVGKKDQMKKFQETGNPNSVNTLNRRNLDIAMQEWARLHKDKVGGSQRSHDDALAKVGNFMMSIGSKLEEPDHTEEDEQEAMKRRVEAVWKHRQEKLEENKSKKKSGVMGSLLSCGGGKSKKVNKSNNQPRAQPYVPSDTEVPPTDEVATINERCANVLALLISAGCEIDKTENAFGMTALDMAVLNGDVESSAQLVSAGGDPDHLMKMFALSDLYEVLIMKQKKELKDLLTFDSDLDINMPFSRFSITNKPTQQSNHEESGDEGLMPIAVATKTDDVEIVKMLIKHGADVNGVGPAGRAPIHEGAGKGLTKMCGFLLQQGGNQELQATGFLNATPVTIAAIMRHHRTVELFLSRVSKIDKTLSDSTNSLLKSAAQNDMEMILITENKLFSRGSKIDKTLSDSTNSLLKSAAQNDMEMIHLILQANLQMNFIDPNGFMFNMASKYQSKERDVNSILQEVHEEVSRLESIEMEKERQRQLEEESRNRILPRPQPKPVQAPPQPSRPAPMITAPVQPPPQHPPEEEESSEEEESEEEEERAPAEGAPVTSEVILTQAPPKVYKPRETSIDEPPSQPPPQPQPTQPPVAQPPHAETNIDDEEEEESETETEEEESSEEEEESPQAPAVQAPPTGVQAPPTPRTPGQEGPPPPLPELPPPPPPTGPPPGSSDEEEETDEEEEDSEEESEEETDEEEETTTTTTSKQVVQRSVTTEQINGKTTTVTKTTVISTGQGQGPRLANEEDMESEEEETSEEEESSGEEEEGSSEEEESEEEGEEELPANVQNNNLAKPVTALNASHDSKETTI